MMGASVFLVRDSAKMPKKKKIYFFIIKLLSSEKKGNISPKNSLATIWTLILTLVAYF
jgi:hypothetical protein